MSSKSSIAKKIEKLKRRRAQSFAPSVSDFQDAETDENENFEIEEPKKRKKTKKSKLIGTDLPWQRVSMPDLNADLDSVGAAGLIEEIDPELFFSANPQLRDKPVEVKNDVSEDMDLDEDAVEKPKKQKEKKKKKVAKPQQPKQSKTEQEGTTDADVDEFEQPVKKDNQIPSEPPKCLKSEWGSFNLDHKFLYAIDDLGFETPTPIQLKSIPAALRDRKDIVGAAETGSGKTIAFGLPILQQVLEIKEKEARAKKAQLEGSTEEIETKKLSALILTPTRELAVQISRHLKQLTKYTNIKVIPVIGGISIQKQHRLLRGKPEIVVATPGRFWELTNGVESHEYLSDLTSLRFLVLDEADRMIETGHYKELFYILESIKQTEAKLYERDSVNTAFRGEEQEEEDDEDNKKNGKKKVARQTFLFSATLTMKIHKGKIIRSKSDTSIDKLLDVMKFERKIELIDLSTKEMMAATLTEHRIDCMLEDKDIYLYYVLQFFGGSRTLVFVNSISTMKRLLPLLQLLQLNVCGLHAQMQQKQRLKNLERFQSQLNSVLVATDVAARGLDIPLVDHVIHYQLPKVPQMYVHRSGRAGRAQQKGTVVALVSPEDKNQYDTILKSTNKKEDIPLFEVDASFLKDIRERVALARQVEHELYLMSKQNTKSRDWLVKTANEELDAVIATSSGGGEDEDEQYNKNRHAKYVNGLKNQLKRVLKQPLTNNANIRVMSVKQHEKSKGKNTTNFSQVNNAVTMTSLPFMVVKERYKGSREQMQSLSNASKGIKGDPSRRGKRTGSKKIAYS